MLNSFDGLEFWNILELLDSTVCFCWHHHKRLTRTCAGGEVEGLGLCVKAHTHANQNPQERCKIRKVLWSGMDQNCFGIRMAHVALLLAKGLLMKQCQRPILHRTVGPCQQPRSQSSLR